MDFNRDYCYRFQDVNVGDIFCSSWGYNMTIVDFYQCIGKKGKASIILAHLANKHTAGDGWSGEVEPDLTDIEETLTVRIKKNGGMHGKWDHEVLVRWDGKPKYFNSMD